MDWEIIQLAQSTPSPWKNGGGVTRELIAWPESDNWSWRLSVAEVTNDGAFSKFEGVQRWFAVLNGEGVQLQIDNAIHTLTSSSEPLCFDGAAPADCKLLVGATKDFNLMVRSGKSNATMRRLSGRSEYASNAMKIIAIYAINMPASVQFNGESLELQPNTLAWRIVPAGTQLLVDARNALWMEITHHV